MNLHIKFLNKMLANLAMDIFKNSLPDWNQVYFTYLNFYKKATYQWLLGIGAGGKESATMGTKVFQDK